MSLANPIIFTPTNAGIDSITSEKFEWRVYPGASDPRPSGRVPSFYYDNHVNQTFEFVQQQKKKFLTLDRAKMSIWEAAEFMDTFVDQSDPDTEASQIVHSFQTGEMLRRRFPELRWLHIVGFIHDLGKVLGHQKFANEPQWCTVGDTFPVGCKFSDAVVYSQFFKENPDYNNPKYNTECGIYTPGCGFENVHFSWGHDEFLYQVLSKQSTLPPEALYIIRFHSFYAWHQAGAYAHLASDHDRKMLHWLKEFQKCDLYSKVPEMPDRDTLTAYYKGLIAEFFPSMLNW